MLARKFIVDEVFFFGRELRTRGARQIFFPAGVMRKAFAAASRPTSFRASPAAGIALDHLDSTPLLTRLHWRMLQRPGDALLYSAATPSISCSLPRD